MATHNVIVGLDADDYLSLLEMEPNLSAVLHEYAMMALRGELALPRVPPLPKKEGKRETEVRESLLGRLYETAYEKAKYSDGEWVKWHDLRPNLRYRDAYSERIWLLFEEDPDIETRAIQHGARVRRAVRFAPLV